MLLFMSVYTNTLCLYCEYRMSYGYMIICTSVVYIYAVNIYCGSLLSVNL